MSKVLVFRGTAKDGAAHGGFRWPELGPVSAPDWDPRAKCGGGLHGFLWGEGDPALLTQGGRYQIVAVDPADIVDLSGKVKFPRGEVVFSSEDRDAALEYLIANGARGRSVMFARVSAGNYGTATAGDGGTATAGDHGTATAGNFGTATAGDYGTATAGNYGTATAGHRGTATAGDYGTATAGADGTATAGYGGTATAGDRGMATAGYGGTATAGYRGTATAGDDGTATAGYGGTATAGYRGTLVFSWHDDTGRRRTSVAEVGIGGVLPGVAYRCDQGRIVEVKK